MIRSANPSDQREEEVAMQKLMFKINVALFLGSVAAISVGKFF